jgi:hypothetical protein
MADLQQAVERVSSIYPHLNPLQGWVNGRLYLQTKEQFGIAITPDSVMVNNGMQPYEPSTSHLMKFPFLAQQQNTRFAITMVCHDAEKKLFTEFKKSGNPAFSRHRFQQAATIWNARANGRDIFYKVCTSSSLILL